MITVQFLERDGLFSLILESQDVKCMFFEKEDTSFPTLKKRQRENHGMKNCTILLEFSAFIFCFV